MDKRLDPQPETWQQAQTTSFPGQPMSGGHKLGGGNAPAQWLQRGSHLETDSIYKRVLPYILLSLLFGVIAIPLILKLPTGVGTSRDEMLFHYPTVLEFAEQFPAINLRDYKSATTPLYHLLLMGVVLVVGPDLIPLRFVTALLGLLCVLVVYGYLARRGGRVNGFVFTLIFLLSNYFLGSSVVLFTDNLALLFVFLSIWMMDQSVINKPRWTWANILATLAVLTRQIHIWLAGVTLLIGLWHREREENQTGPWRIELANALPALLPITVFALFVLMWRGLTPVAFLGTHESATLINGDALTYIVSLFGFYGIWLITWYWRLYWANHSRRDIVYMALLVIAGVLYLLLNPYIITADADKSSGALWQLANAMPDLASTSIVYWGLFPLGLLLLYITAKDLMLRQEYVMVASIALWTLATLASGRIYQRYYEPFLLFVIGYSLVVLRERKKWSQWIGPVFLMGGLALMTLVRLVAPIFE